MVYQSEADIWWETAKLMSWLQVSEKTDLSIYYIFFQNYKEKEEATVEQAVPFTKYDKVSKHSKSSSSSSSSNLTSSSPSAESIEVQPKNDGTIIPNSNGPEIPWIDSPLSTPTQKVHR